MSQALNATGRHIYYSLCETGSSDPWLWASELGNSWRTAGDIADGYESMLRALDDTVGLSRYAGPGLGWNDPDMLEVGNGGMAVHEYQAHFALWAVLKAPLLLGHDLEQMTDEILKIISAPEVIALNQDPLGVAGDLIAKSGPDEVYATILSDYTRGVVLFNRHDPNDPMPTETATVNFPDLGWTSNTTATVRNLYERRDLGTFTGSFTTEFPAHHAMALKVTPTSSSILHSQANMEWRPWHTTIGQQVHDWQVARRKRQLQPLGVATFGGWDAIE